MKFLSKIVNNVKNCYVNNINYLFWGILVCLLVLLIMCLFLSPQVAFLFAPLIVLIFALDKEANKLESTVEQMFANWRNDICFCKYIMILIGCIIVIYFLPSIISFI